MSAAVDYATFDYGRVFGRMVDALRRNYALLGGLALLLYGLPQLGSTLLEYGGGGLPFFGPALEFTAFLYDLVAVLGFFALQATVVYVFIRDLDGETPSLRGCLRAAMRTFLPLLGLFIVWLAAVAAGLIALVVPGVMIACALFVAMPALVVERLPVMAAIDRSRWLTRNYRWSVFGFVAIMIVVGAVLGNAADGWRMDFGPLFLLDRAAHAAGALVEDIFQIAFALVLSLLVSSTYYELRLIKEDATSTDVAADLE